MQADTKAANMPPTTDAPRAVATEDNEWGGFWFGPSALVELQREVPGGHEDRHVLGALEPAACRNHHQDKDSGMNKDIVSDAVGMGVDFDSGKCEDTGSVKGSEHIASDVVGKSVDIDTGKCEDTGVDKVSERIVTDAVGKSGVDNGKGKCEDTGMDKGSEHIVNEVVDTRGVDIGKDKCEDTGIQEDVFNDKFEAIAVEAIHTPAAGALAKAPSFPVLATAGGKHRAPWADLHSDESTDDDDELGAPTGAAGSSGANDGARLQEVQLAHGRMRSMLSLALMVIQGLDVEELEGEEVQQQWKQRLAIHTSEIKDLLKRVGQG